MKKGIAVLAALLVAGAAGGGTYYQFIYKNSSGDRVSSQSENAIFVDSVELLAGLGSGSGQIPRFAGVVEPQKTWSAKLDSESKVKELHVEVGDLVKTGDRLFTYDQSEKEDALAQNEIDLERKQFTLENEKRELEQLKTQAKKATGDRAETIKMQILQQENSIKQSEYDIQAMELTISQLKEDLKDADVYSELDGVVKSITDPNSSNSYYGGDDSNAYITITAVGDYRVKGTINEQNMGAVSTGDQMIAFSRVDSKKYWTGTVSEISRENASSNQQNDYYSDNSGSSDTNSSNYPFYVMLDESDELMLGQHVYLEPDYGQTNQKDGIWLPDYYFEIREDGSAFIWAASAKNTLEKRQVTLGEYDDDMSTYEVKAGLTADDYIVQPSEILEEGAPVSYNDYSMDTGMYEDSDPAWDMAFMGDDSDWDGDDWDDEDGDWEEG